MMRRIKSDEYLKGYGAMSEDESKDYRKRVGEWLAEGGRQLIDVTDRPMAKAQNIVQLSMRWKEPEVRMFTEGVRLLSALVGVADTWLPTQLYAKSAYRAVRQMHDVLLLVQGSKLAKGGDTIASQQTKKALPMMKTVSKEYDPKTDTVRIQCVVAPAKETQGGAGDCGLVPVRPRHIDQYVHLLPEKTQERAAQYGPLMRDMGAARESLRLLMDDTSASAKNREQWAKVITRIDGEVKKIREELDREWEKLVKQGRVAVDDLGNARVIPTGESQDTVDEPAELTSEQKTRRRELRKFLVDTRRGNGKTREEHVGKWQEAWKEYLTLEPQETAIGDEKIQEAAKHYGIEIDTLKTNSQTRFYKKHDIPFNS